MAPTRRELREAAARASGIEPGLAPSAEPGDAPRTEQAPAGHEPANQASTETAPDEPRSARGHRPRAERRAPAAPEEQAPARRSRGARRAEATEATETSGPAVSPRRAARVAGAAQPSQDVPPEPAATPAAEPAAGTPPDRAASRPRRAARRETAAPEPIDAAPVSAEPLLLEPLPTDAPAPAPGASGPIEVPEPPRPARRSRAARRAEAQAVAPPGADAQPDATAPEAAERPVDPDAATGSAQPDPTEPPEPGELPESPATPGAADAVADPEAANASDVVPDAGDPADRAVSHGFDAESDTGPIRFNIGAIAMPVPPVLADEPENFPAMAAAEPPTPKASIGMRMLRRVGVFASAASIVGLIVGTTIPAYTPDPNDARAAAVMATQKLLASGGTVTAFDPGGFEALEPSEMQAELNLLSADSFDNNTEAIVQYPFSHGVPLTDGFGWRDYPVAQLHDAQDFAAGNGAAVRSIADGVVIESGPVADGCGTGVRIQHSIDGQDVTSRYCHMQTDSNAVQVGDEVKVGQLVGLVGQTGLSFGPHLHLVVQVNGKAIDPMPFLAKYNASSAK